jgi:hypothetical protein
VAPADTFEILRTRPHGHAASVLGTLEKLGLDRLLAARRSPERDRAVALIVARVLAPEFELGTARVLDAQSATSTLGEMLGLETVEAEDLYRAMDWLGARQAKIERTLAEQHLHDGALVLYDVNSSYFEGRTRPLAATGYSREGKKSSLQIVLGLLCNADGCPVAVEFHAGNTGDPITLQDQVEKVRSRFGLSRVVFVGDRGLLTRARIHEELAPVEGLDWVGALRSEQIRKLAEDDGPLQPSLFDQTDLAEIRHPDFPGERLIACKNPLLAAEHFETTITDAAFTYGRKQRAIDAEATLDGIYVLRTSVPKDVLATEDTVRAYKNLAKVERAFRCLETVDRHVRPIRHRLEQRVRAHTFLCMLAYYVEWHMRLAWAPLLFAENDPADTAERRGSPVKPATRSASAEARAYTKRTPEGETVHHFRELLDHLATLTKNTIQPTGDLPPFDRLTVPTPLQQKAFDLLGVPIPM